MLYWIISLPFKQFCWTFLLYIVVFCHFYINIWWYFLPASWISWVAHRFPSWKIFRDYQIFWSVGRWIRLAAGKTISWASSWEKVTDIFQFLNAFLKVLALEYKNPDFCVFYELLENVSLIASVELAVRSLFTNLWTVRHKFIRCV